MPAPLAILDACVLYPAPLRDLFMRLHLAEALHAHWTDEIHDEWIRNVARNYGIPIDVLERTRRLMDEHASEAKVHDYAHWLAKVRLTETKDRHVVAAALKVKKDWNGAQVTIVTWNIRDFSTQELTAHGLAKANPDTFVNELLRSNPEAVLHAARTQRRSLKNPPLSVGAFLETLRQQRLTRTVATLGQYKADLE